MLVEDNFDIFNEMIQLLQIPANIRNEYTTMDDIRIIRDLCRQYSAQYQHTPQRILSDKFLSTIWKPPNYGGYKQNKKYKKTKNKTKKTIKKTIKQNKKYKKRKTK